MPPTQQRIPGTEPKKNVKIHNRALKLSVCRDELKAMRERESDLRAELVREMKRQDVHAYSYGGVNVERLEVDRVKCKVEGEQDGEEQE